MADAQLNNRICSGPVTAKLVQAARKQHVADKSAIDVWLSMPTFFLDVDVRLVTPIVLRFFNDRLVMPKHSQG